MKNSVFISFILFVCFCSEALSQHETKFEKSIYVNGKDILNYRILYPNNFNPEKKYPLVLFLHGAGERGSDNEKQLTHGASLFLKDDNRELYPAIVIFPQCPKNDYWASADIDRSPSGNVFEYDYSGEPNPALGLVMQLIDSLKNQTYVDRDKLYVGGLSMGGMGTYELLHRRPNTFAAAIVICGGGNPESVENYAQKVSLWIFHGMKDDVVLPSYAEKMVTALKKHNADLRYTQYREANHNSWDSAFAEAELLPFLFSKEK